MSKIDRLFNNNREWAGAMTRQNPSFFSDLAEKQSPPYLWIGCADSREPASQVVGLGPGDLFVHRNIANVVVHTDLNCLSTIQFAVEVLKVRHIIVCGHYGCGGVLAALDDNNHGLIDNWLRHIQAVHLKHQAELDALETLADKHRRLCELNVIEQAANVGRTTIVKDAWARGQALTVHGWIYELEDGLLHDLDADIDGS